LAEKFRVDFHERYVGTLLKKLGFSHISAGRITPRKTRRGDVPLYVESAKRASLVENLRSLRGLDKMRVR
jgi:hypothetical protein